MRGHVHGIVTSASLMVWQPAATTAVAAARRHPRLSLGLHVDLAEWELDGGEWRLRYGRVDIDDAAAVAGEVDRQLERFRRLTGREPTHLDSHQHLHRSPPLGGVLGDRAARLGVPLRGPGEPRYCGVVLGPGQRRQPRPPGDHALGAGRADSRAARRRHRALLPPGRQRRRRMGVRRAAAGRAGLAVQPRRCARRCVPPAFGCWDWPSRAREHRPPDAAAVVLAHMLLDRSGRAAVARQSCPAGRA